MVTSFKRSYACTATLSAPIPAAGHHLSTPPLEAPGHSQASLGQSLVGSLLLSPGSWCTRFCLPQSHLKRITLKILLFSLGRKKPGTLIVPYPMVAFKNTTFTFNLFAYVLLFPWYRWGTESLKCQRSAPELVTGEGFEPRNRELRLCLFLSCCFSIRSIPKFREVENPKP